MASFLACLGQWQHLTGEFRAPAGTVARWIALEKGTPDLTQIDAYLDATRTRALASCGYPTWGYGSLDGKDLAAGHQLFGPARDLSLRQVLHFPVPWVRRFTQALAVAFCGRRFQS